MSVVLDSLQFFGTQIIWKWLPSDLQIPLLALQVSWLRHDNLTILSVGRYTYTSDQRYQAFHEDDLAGEASRSGSDVASSDDEETWILRIRPVRMRDEGRFDCQVSTRPVSTHSVYLRVVGRFRISIMNS